MTLKNTKISFFLVYIRDLVFEPTKTVVDTYKERKFGNDGFFYSFVLIASLLIFFANLLKHCLVLRSFAVDELIKDVLFEPIFFIVSYYFSYYVLRFFYDKVIPDKIDNVQLNYILIPVYTIFMLVQVLLCFFVNLWLLNLFYILALPVLWIFSQGVLDLENKIKYFLFVSSMILVFSSSIVRIVFSFFAPNF